MPLSAADIEIFKRIFAQMTENMLGLRRTVIGLMASEQALMEQLTELGHIDADRWERDKIRHAAALEQTAAAKDEEGQAELRDENLTWLQREWEDMFGPVEPPPNTGVE